MAPPERASGRRPWRQAPPRDGGAGPTLGGGRGRRRRGPRRGRRQASSIGAWARVGPRAAAGTRRSERLAARKSGRGARRPGVLGVVVVVPTGAGGASTGGAAALLDRRGGGGRSRGGRGRGPRVVGASVPAARPGGRAVRGTAGLASASGRPPPWSSASSAGSVPPAVVAAPLRAGRKITAT